jgi:hypothetical protein
MIGALLNHKSNITSQVYVQFGELDVKRSLADKGAKLLRAALAHRPKACRALESARTVTIEDIARTNLIVLDCNVLAANQPATLCGPNRSRRRSLMPHRGFDLGQLLRTIRASAANARKCERKPAGGENIVRFR